jgi:bacteriocin biosynthesis cyclodehydratase domain-containing protein
MSGVPADDGAPATAERVLRLRPGVRVVPGGADDPASTWVWINSRVLRLRGAAAPRVLAAIDGTRTADEVAREVGAASPGELAPVLERFRRAGLLDVDAGPSPARGLPPLLRLLADQGADATAVAAELAGGRAAVLGAGMLSAAVADALADVGIGTVSRLSAETAGDAVEGLEDVDVAVMALDGSSPWLADAVNAAALRSGTPWLAVEAGGAALRLGPFVLPHETACWTCFSLRLEANDAAAGERGAARRALDAAGQGTAEADDLTPGVAAVACHLAALEVARFFAARTGDAVAPALYGQFADYSLLAHRAAPQRVLRLPRCPSCGARARGRPTVRAWMEPYGGDG